MNHIISKTYPVLNMHCAGCANNVEKTVRKLHGVSDVSVNFANNTMTVFFNDKQITPGEIRAAVLAVGYDVDITNASLDEQEEQQSRRYQLMKKKLGVLWVVCVLLFIAAMFFRDNTISAIFQLILSGVALAYFGAPYYIAAWKQVKHGRSSMDSLITLSTSITYIFSFFNVVFPSFWLDRGVHPHIYFDAVIMILAFVQTGKLLEERAKGTTTSAIKKLMGLQPKTARVIRNGVETEINLDQLMIGDEVAVRPGEQIPVDGTVLSGDSFVDESMVTGEPMAVHKIKDRKVMAGTINQSGSFTMKAEKVGADTLLSHIIEMVQKAQGSKAPVQRIVDKVTNVFVPVVLGLSILTFILWMAIGGEGMLSYGLLSAVSVLVIACPCALGLATPTALMVGIGRAAESHILVKDAVAMEQLKRVNVIIMDKTGTLTEGSPKVKEWLWNTVEDVKIRSILMAMEMKSEHPLAKAVVERLRKEGVASTPIEGFITIPGKGIEAKADGRDYWVGNQLMLNEHQAVVSTLLQELSDHGQKEGTCISFFGRDNEVLAVMSISDAIKPTSSEAVKELRRQGIEVWMLTGDTQEAADVVAKQLGIAKVYAQALPDDKERVVKEAQSMGKVVAMVGDGINDSQALASADVSIAMGKGTDIAMDVAMITLMTSDLLLLPKAVELSKRTVRLIRENLFWALIYNIIGIPIAGGILYPAYGILLKPIIASAAMACSSVSVVLNSLKLK